MGLYSKHGPGHSTSQSAPKSEIKLVDEERHALTNGTKHLDTGPISRPDEDKIGFFP